jgi:hypothetical protein
VSKTEGAALKLFEELYPEREFEPTVYLPRDIDILPAQRTDTEADVISTNNDELVGCEVKESVAELQKGFKQLNDVYKNAEEFRCDADYKLVVFDDRVLRMKHAIDELPYIFSEDELNHFDDSMKANSFMYSHVLRPFEKVNREVLTDEHHLPVYDFEMLEEEGFIERTGETTYTGTEKAAYLANDSRTWLHPTPRLEFLYHPTELV